MRMAGHSESSRRPSSNLSAVFAVPPQFDPAVLPDDDGDSHGVIERLFPPVGVLVHAALLEVDSALAESDDGFVADFAVSQGVDGDGHGRFLPQQS